MPVTIKPSPEKVGTNRDATATSEQDLFAKLVSAWEKEVDFDDNPHSKPWMTRDPNQSPATSRSNKPILHSSFKEIKSTANSSIIPYGNGFVDGIIRAFQQDLHLALRPDDVWLAILTQFSFYVDKHASRLRSKFVKHAEGKEKLVLSNTSAFADIDMGAMAEKFIPLMKGHMADDSITDWLLPTFSTTTSLDRAVSSMLMMATVKQYFDYVMLLGCGFPSVTLHGEVSDWERILSRLDRFAEFGEEPAAWVVLLKPIVKRFIAVFYSPDAAELRDFWMRAIHAEGEWGSGEAPTFDGWLTAFMFWEKEGGRTPRNGEDEGLVLDGVKYPVIRQNRRGVPTGVVEVPVVVEAYDLGVKLDTRIVAGSMGVTVKKHEGGEGGEVVQPCSGWWMLEYGREAL